MDISKEIENIPSTRYQGSKRKILPWIYDCIKDVDFLLNSQPQPNGFIADTFRDIYFLDEENRWLDMVVSNIESLSALYSNAKLRYKKAIAYNALFQSCLAKRPYNLFHRKNLDMRTRDVERSFGNFSN